MKRLRRIIAITGVISVTAISSQGQTNFSVYFDQLNNGFENWTHGSIDFSSTSAVHSGSSAINFKGAVWDTISIAHAGFNPAPYTNLTFWLNGGPDGGQVVRVNVGYGTNAGPYYQLPALRPNRWRQFNLSLGTLGVAEITNVNRINFQLTTSGKSGPFSMDDINLVATVPSPIRITVDAAKTVRVADSRWFGLNTVVWDGNFDTATTMDSLKKLGTSILRFPGGSAADEYHWAAGKDQAGKTWPISFGNFVHVATNVGVQAMITVNYGTGTPDEAAAWVRSANITNHLGFQYWEIGNEVYGSWETDSNHLPHDPYIYALRVRDYIGHMKAADPSIKVGVVAVPGEGSYSNNATHFAVNARTGTTNYGWTPIMLSTFKSLGIAPDFLVHHVYPEYSADNDQGILLSSGNWAGDAADFRQQINDYMGGAQTNIELLCTENNADAGRQGKQSTSIVNGLYLADSLAQLMKTEFNSFIWWNFRNGTDHSGDFNASLYGWRMYGDLGIINGLAMRHPVFYTFKLMRCFAERGDAVLDPQSNYLLLPVYSTRKADGSLAVLVINKDRTMTLTAQLTLTNFEPGPRALVRSFGLAQDEAARTNSVPGAQDIQTNILGISGATFIASFPPYTVTLLTIPPAPLHVSATGLPR